MSIVDYSLLALGRLVMQSPLLAISVIGLWFSIRRKNQHSSAFKWAAWGFSLLTVYSVTTVIAQVVGMGIRRQISDPATVALTYSISGFVPYLFFLAGLALLARSLFIRRDEERVSGASPRSA